MIDFNDISVVVPTNRDSVVTLETVPVEAEVLVRRDEGLNVARNEGVKAAASDWIVIADDDIRFPSDLVVETINEIDRMTLAGLADFLPLRWVIGRLLIFHRDLWERVGGFDERRHHGGDTDFAIRVEKVGGTVRRLDRKSVPHFDEDTGIGMSTREHIEWATYLLRRHPSTFGPVAAKLLFRRLDPR
ncbi:glycosyltransferase family 2 protein [Halapricum desulfuricans]|uniref:glycosyltransferase family 2 protein n=1 Tax=Halapricum desulfuricans TaxID=2841257 RepID=UPI001E3EF5A5|nr:glycosyltransferase [Halapricum desulfuricans]